MLSKIKKAFIGLLAAAMLVFTLPVEAKYRGSFSSRSTTSVRSVPSFSRPTAVPRFTAPRTPTYSAPRPVYRSTPTYRSSSTTIINQRSGGGFFSNMLSSMTGAFAGMALFQWLFGDKDKEQQPAPAAAAPVTQ